MTELLQDSLQQADVLGLPIHLAHDYATWLSAQLSQRQGVHVVTLNAEMAMQAEQDAALAEVIRKAELVVPDGSGVVFYLKLRNQHVERCPGIELSESLLQAASKLQGDAAVFFYGGAPGVAQAAATRWQQDYPGLAIAGVQHGFISTQEQDQLCKTLQTLQPAIILVGLGVPRQEFWIDQHRHLCPNAIWVGVGGSFDIWAGMKVRAPDFFRKNHLEWLYRLYQEPWRWRRMLALPQFAWRAVVTLVGR